MSEPSYETKLRDRVALIALKRQDPHRGTLGGQDAVGIADAFMRERARRLAAEQERAGEQAEAWRYFRRGAEVRRVRAHDVYELRRNTWRLVPHAPSEDWYAAAEEGWHEITRAEAEAGMVDEPAAEQERAGEYRYFKGCVLVYRVRPGQAHEWWTGSGWHMSSENLLTAEKFVESEFDEITLDQLPAAARAALASKPERLLVKRQPCGCVICTCEDEEKCQGCGSRHCGAHPVGVFRDPVYVAPPPERAGER